MLDAPHSPQSWLKKAREDVSVARMLSDEEKFPGSVSFHAQQAVEKYLKAYLTAKRIHFEFTHDLAKLAAACVTHDGAFAPLVTQLGELTRFVVNGRYPVPLPREPTESDAVAAMAAAEAVAALVEPLLEAVAATPAPHKTG